MENTKVAPKVRKSKLNQKSASEIAVRTVASVFWIFWGITLLVPLFFGLNSALKTNGLAFMQDPVSIVLFDKPQWGNFAKAFDEISCNGFSFIEMTWNSLFFAILPTAVALFFTVAVAYIVGKYNKYRIMGFAYSLILTVQFIPLYGNLPATYKLFTDLNFINSRMITVASMGVSFGNFLYAYAFFKAISWTYAEAAMIDGAGHWQTFLKVMLPQIIPSVAVIYITSFIATWNDFQTCLLYYADELPTLSYGIYRFYEKSVYAANQPVYMAGCLICSIPSIILFLIFQDQLMNKLMIGGLKG